MTGITLLDDRFGNYVLEADNLARGIVLVQSDYDYPGVATTFGWVISDVIGAPGHSSCYHDGTDGTIDCESCGRTASEFIEAARAFLDDNIGATADDPGYFSEAVQ